MATRENQGLQIALILFVMITVALGVTTYIFYSQSVKAEADKKKAETDLAAVTKTNKGLDFQSQWLKAMVGALERSPAEIKTIDADLAKANPKIHGEMKAIETSFNEDMALFKGSDLVLGDGQAWQGPQNWTTLPDFLVRVIQKKNLEWKDEQDRATKAENDKTALVNQEVSKTKQAETAQQAAHDDLVTERNQFTKDRDSLNKDKSDLQQQLTDRATKHKTELDALQSERKSLETETAQLKGLNLALVEQKREFERKDYDVPHGNIRWVNQRSRTVYINLGLMDGLQRQTTFSVYDRDETNHSKAEPKASIEVTQLVDRHLSEARILDDDLRNPILPGDFIFTPTWAPGRKVHFALAGFMDFDGDGKSDRQIMRNLITSSGGVIDAEVLDEGPRSGTMTAETRYLVQGDVPDQAQSGEAYKNYSDLDGEATQLGVEKIHVTKLLGFMGYKGEVTTTSLGRRAAAEGTQPPSPFKPRTPERGSAYAR